MKKFLMVAAVLLQSSSAMAKTVQCMDDDPSDTVLTVELNSQPSRMTASILNLDGGSYGQGAKESVKLLRTSAVSQEYIVTSDTPPNLGLIPNTVIRLYGGSKVVKAELGMESGGAFHRIMTYTCY